MLKNLLTIICFAFTQVVFSQVICYPYFPRQIDSVTIIYDATQGNGALEGVSPIYIHSGLITNNSSNLSDWQHVSTTWAVTDPDFEMLDLGDNKHQFSFKIDDYFGVLSNEEVFNLAFVFRNGDGTIVGRGTTGEDIFYPVYDNTFAAGFVLPNDEPLIYREQELVNIVVASSQNADFEITYNNNNILNTSNTTEATISFDATEYGPGLHEFYMVSSSGSQQVVDTIALIVQPESEELTAPEGLNQGVQVTGEGEVTMCLLAPGKEFVYVLGDFNDWSYDLSYLMKKDSQNELFWLTIEGLDPMQEYRFQYSIGEDYLRLADVYSDKVLDPYNDEYISEDNYPGLTEYPISKTNGIVSTFKIDKTDDHIWQDEAFVRPDKEKLIIYELLLRDFLETQSYQDLIDTLDYLEYIGINAIELMPINEFEGNNSWGYNPSFYFAVDKNYGTKNQFKAFVDACHHRGIAVILDISLNHSFGQNPQVQMYFDSSIGEWGQPTSDNPWFNETPKHDFNVGYDYNHQSPHTKEFCKRVLNYWVDVFHVDGFRFDLSKGFTQNYTLGDIDGWSNYDQSRIDILTEYASDVWQNTPGTYMILEHFASNWEETALSNNGFMLWGNMNHNYAQASMGYGADLSWGVHSSRGWSNANLITYMESHDEERIMFSNKNYGNSSGSYFIQMSNTALARIELSLMFLIPIPGPKMVWQFGEMGYDYSINYCENGTVDEDCRTAPKPIRWDYLINPNRVKLLKVFKALNELKTSQGVFSTTDFNYDLSGTGKRIHLNSNDENVVILGNFGVEQMLINPNFQHEGQWHDYFGGEQLLVSDVNAEILLAPGEYKLFTDFELPSPDLSTTMNLGLEDIAEVDGLLVYPNPVKNTLHFKVKETITSASLYSVDGKRLIYQEGDQKALDISKMSFGVYFVKLKTKKNQYLKKVIIHE